MRMMFAVVAGLVLIGAAPIEERVIEAGGMVDGQVAGAPGRLRVDAAGTAMPLISAEWAARAGLKRSFFGIAYLVGKERVTGSTAVAQIDVGGTGDKRRVGWTEKPFTKDADGVIGPGGLDAEVIRFVLRPARSGERTIDLPLIGQGGVANRWGELFARST